MRALPAIFKAPTLTLRDAAAICAFALSLPAHGMQPPDITANEKALVPAYCMDTQLWGGPPGGIERGKAIYGEVFWAMHHYCWAMVWQMRGERSTYSPMERRGFLFNALDDYDYVLRYTPPDHFLLPEMLTRKGKVLRMQGKYTESANVLREAITLNKNYWRAFAELAVCFDLAGDKDQAAVVLREGLAANPGVKTLQLHLQELEQGKGEPARPKSRSARGPEVKDQAKALPK